MECDRRAQYGDSSSAFMLRVIGKHAAVSFMEYDAVIILFAGADKVDNRHCMQQTDFPARLLDSTAQVHILVIQEKGFIQQTHLLQHLPPDHHARPGNPVDLAVGLRLRISVGKACPEG